MAKKTSRVRDIPEGYELRGHRLRLYPTREQVERLTAMQDEMRKAWNLLVGWRIAHLDACVARAERDGVIGPAPARPGPITPETDTPELRARWQAYVAEASARRAKGISYGLEQPGYGWMRLGTNAWDYGPLRQFVAGDAPALCTAHQYQALIKNFQRAKRPRPRRPHDEMPLQVLSGKCYERRGVEELDNGRRGRRSNATIIFSGMRIRALEPWRLSRGPRYPEDTPVLEGVALTRETDGWYAAVRLVLPKKRPPPWSIDAAVGVALGLDVLCATSTGRLFRNVRRAETTSEVAALQKDETEAGDEKASHWKYPDGTSIKISRQSERRQTQLSRRVKQIVTGEVLPYLSQYRWVFVAPDEEGDLKAMAQGPQTRLTPRGRGGYVSAMGILRDHILALGPDRVRTVEWFDISRTCSRCGALSKGWAWRQESANGQCTACGYVEHRRINTARNVLVRGLESLSSGETPIEALHGGKEP